MYTSFYGFREKPFSLSPDPRYLFLAASHSEALAHLLYGIEHGEGFIAITGEVGTGKTTLSRTLLQRMPPGSEVAFILNPDLSAHDLLCAINEEFGLRSAGLSKREIHDQLNRFLLEQNQAQRRVLLIIDEAQSLPEHTLEQVRLLSNLETDTAKLLQIILLGQPELDAKLQLPELRQLRQRITVWWKLAPLSAAETGEYVAHRLRIASGGERKIFSDAALAAVHRCTGGIPRLINVLCDRALLAAYGDNVLEVDAEIVRRVARELHGQVGGAWRPKVSALLSSWKPRAASRATGVGPRPLVLLLVLGILGLSFGYFAKRSGWLAAAQRIWQTSPSAAERAAVSHSTLLRVEPTAAATSAPVASASRELTDGNPAAAGFPIPAPLRAPAVAAVRAPELPSLWPASDAAASKDFARVPWLSVAEPKTPEQSEAELPFSDVPLAQLLAAVTPGLSCANATNAMLQLWGMEPRVLEPLPMAGALLELEKQGLRTLWLQVTSLDELRKINYPALLTFANDDTGLRMATLKRFDGESVVLTGLDGETHFRVRQAEFEEHWSHSAAIVWRDFETLPDRIQPGSRDAATRWLQACLHALGFYAPEPSGMYDAQTATAVRQFQKQLELEADGVVGVRTKLMLYGASPEYTIPKLHSAEDAG